MEYVLFSENEPTKYWQLELLLQSFKQLNQEANLLIVIIGENVTSLPVNIAKHDRLLSLQDIGNKKGYERLNYLYGLGTLLENQTLSQPFTLLDLDLVLYKPIEDKSKYNLSFQVDLEITLDKLKENGCGNVEDYLKAVSKERNVPMNELWLPLGKTMAFYNVPMHIFPRAAAFAEKLVMDQLEADLPIWKHTDRAAWICALLEHYGLLKYNATFEYEMNMLESRELRNFVNYEHGMPPIFSKNMFNSDDFKMAGESPFHLLSKHAPSVAAYHLQKISKELLSKG